MAPKLDLRFADAEDLQDILQLIESAFAVQGEDVNTVHGHAARYSQSSLEADLSGKITTRRWIVLETPAPEERVVAAALMQTGLEPGHAQLHALAVAPDMQKQGVGSLLLRRTEGILLSLRCRWVTLQTTQWRNDVLSWACHRGYVEVGGGLLPVEGTARPTRYLDLRHDLLADPAVSHDFGEGSERYVAAAAGTCSGSCERDSNTEQAVDEADSQGAGAAEGVAAKTAPNSAQYTAAADADAVQLSAATAADSSADANEADPMQALASVFKSLGVADIMTAVNSSGSSTSVAAADSSSVASERDLSSMESLLSGLLGSLNTASGKSDFDRLASRHSSK